jgi:hypothetical protein
MVAEQRDQAHGRRDGGAATEESPRKVLGAQEGPTGEEGDRGRAAQGRPAGGGPRKEEDATPLVGASWVRRKDPPERRAAGGGPHRGGRPAAGHAGDVDRGWRRPE